jgi:PAS domain S-box-containing protein
MFPLFSSQRIFHLLSRYGMAVTSVGLALVVTNLIMPAMSATISLLFFAAMMISAWYGGFGPGILAALLSTLALDYFFISPIHAWSFNIVDVIIFISLTLASVLISAQSATRKRAEEALRQSRDEMETRVQQRTAELATTNQSLESEITERRRSSEALRDKEDRLRLAVESAALGTWDYNPITGVLAWDDACKAIFDLPPDTEVTYKVFRSAIHPDDRNRTQASIVRAFDSQSGGKYDAEYRIIGLQDGIERWIAARGQAFFNEAGLAARFIGTVLDITERKRAEQERALLLAREKAARVEAEEANRLKDEFLATVSHELRTPLNAILGWAELLRGGRLDDESARRAFDIIVRNAKSQAQLIEDLLDVSRIIMGNFGLEVRPVGLAQIINSAIEAVRPAAYAKEIELDVSYDKSVAPVSGDPTRLQQVVWNLLSNAIKFTPNGGRVEVRLDHDDASARISVIDTGCGISKEFLPHVFDRFRQADSSYTRQHSGLGLGLAIVRHLVEMHGGTVRVESDGEGRGAAFIVMLPLLKDEGGRMKGEEYKDELFQPEIRN